MDQSEPVVLAELDDRVEQIFAAIEQLRESGDDGRTKRELLDALFRNVHNVKAIAAANSFEQLRQTAHKFENLLHSLRVGQVKLDDDVLNTFDEMAQHLFASFNPGEGGEQFHTEKAGDLPQPTIRGRRAETEIVLNSLPAEILQSLSEHEKHRLRESLAEGANLYLLNTNFDVGDFDHQFQLLKDQLTQNGEVVSTSPKARDDRPDKINFRILYMRDAEIDQVRAELSSLSDVSVSEVVDSASLDFSSEENTGISNERPNQPGASSNSAQVATNFIRINRDELDRLISTTHALFRQVINGFDYALGHARNQPASARLQTIFTDVNTSFLELAAELVELRMVAVDRVLRRAQRSGRAAARAAGKDIDFIVTGNDIKLDKTLAEAIADPLIHLVRNAVDHGIESPEERINLGKNQKGQVSIEAATIQGQTRITVTDDGRGIDATAITKVAARQGLVQDGSQVTMERSLRLIFRPGFSTATRVSDTSGRGVGLDAVETAIEEVGGAIRVASVHGEGSSFEIRLPVTFGLLDVIEVVVGGQKYLIDRAHIMSGHEVNLTKLEISDSGQAVKIGEKLLRLYFLSELLGYTSESHEQRRTLLVCQSRKEDSKGVAISELAALIVDSMKGPQKVLVRNLGSRGSRWFGVAGASELRDGTVALLLDLPRLLK